MSSSSPSSSSLLISWVYLGAMAYLFYVFCSAAYKIRMGAIDEYGRVIHEFDPYFNYRATEYLYWNGWERFSKWFDYMSWYPLGRPVGTTIYPGLQVTVVFIKKYMLFTESINDICCFVPVWFGVIASIFTGLIAYEATITINSSSSIFGYIYDLWKGEITKITPPPPPTTTTKGTLLLTPYSPAMECFLVTLGLMAIVPAHLMRSIGGGYDNEAIAMTTMVMTFYFWMRSLRTNDSYAYLYGFITAISYFYMVATWGGYVFVLNMIGVHAVCLVFMGRFQFQIYAAYSIFYVLGTLLAMQIPVVGWTPLKSLEQLGPLAVFIGYQLLMITEWIKNMKKLNRYEAWKLRFIVAIIAGVIALLIILFIIPKGYFGPLSSRVRGLFVKHTKTGNPLVDSVAEHQASSPKAYFQFLHHVCFIAPLGYLIIFFKLSDSSSFLLAWGATAYYFSHKMNRLILLTAPIGCVCAGILGGRILAWSIAQWVNQTTEISVDDAVAAINANNNNNKKQLNNKGGEETSTENNVIDPNGAKAAAAAAAGKRKKKKHNNNNIYQTSATSRGGGGSNKQQQQSGMDGLMQLRENIEVALKTKEGILAKRALAAAAIFITYLFASKFVPYCFALARQLSHPTVIQKARTREGKIVMIDDYRDSYFWLRDNTPEDARVMAWWDYGYQIAGIANRTTIADGNTWNHEHIALLGKALTADYDEGYQIARHWADYVLIWGGGGGDDLAKSPHLARIANSVYRDHCPGDPTCRAFGFIDRQGNPSDMMRRSFLYVLHSAGIRPDVPVPTEFTEVYRSKYGKVRIWKLLNISEESKEWVANPANRVCDAPGSWYCPGQYPPGLNSILSKKKDFQQLEDFNRGGADAEYTKQYFEALSNPEKARRKHLEKNKAIDRSDGGDDESSEAPRVSENEKRRLMEMLYSKYEDTEQSTMMWEYIQNGDLKSIQMWLEDEPWWAYLRSADGRGPMWWAFEKRNNEIVQYLISLGVPHTDRDSQGLSPADMEARN